MMREGTPAFGAELQRYRARAGLTQEELAERAGLAAATVSALERGARRLPYRHTRLQLAQALGLSPAEQAAFTGSHTGARRADANPAATPALPARPPTNLPAPRQALIGRGQEVAAVCDLLLQQEARLVTLTGAGGSGKTRLALEVARELTGDLGRQSFADGVWLVELAPVADPALVPQAIATALGVPEAPGVPLVDTLVQAIGPRRLLLLLDNCEHLVDACAALAERLLATCPAVQILPTGREALQVVGEQRWRVPPLAAPDPKQWGSLAELSAYPAVQLFLARAQAVVPSFRLTEANAAAVAGVCARLDGLPLALELAAVRVGVLTVGQILARLDDALRLLTGGSRSGPSRQQTLQATLDWSHNLLAEPEQALFRRLAVFVGAFELEAAEEVAVPSSGEPIRRGTGETEAAPESLVLPRDGGMLGCPQSLEVLDLLTQLVDKSLVQVESCDTAAARYRLLELVRQYAAQQLAASGEAEALRARHASHYLALAEQAATKLRGPDQAAWLNRLDADRANLRAALSWAEECGEAEIGLRLAVALTSFWEGRGHLGEGRRWFAGLRDMAPATNVAPSLRLATLLGAGRLAYWHGDLEESAALFTRCLSGARELGDRQAMADALTWLAAVRRRQGATAEAAALLQESLPTYRELGDEPGTALTLLNLALVAESVPQAILLLEEVLRRYRALGDVRFIAFASVILAGVLTSVGDRTCVPELLHEALARFQEVGDHMFLLSGLLTFAWVAGQMGQPELAARLLGATEAQRDVLGASLAPANQLTQDSALAEIRARLGAAEIAAAWEAGRALSLEQLIAEAKTVGAAGPSPVEASAAGSRERLTRREREVARLLTQGSSDREIATALGISVRTVGVHVQHLLAKLDLHSRSQVAERLAAVDESVPSPE